MKPVSEDLSPDEDCRLVLTVSGDFAELDLALFLGSVGASTDALFLAPLGFGRSSTDDDAESSTSSTASSSSSYGYAMECKNHTIARCEDTNLLFFEDLLSVASFFEDVVGIIFFLLFFSWCREIDRRFSFY